MRRWIGLGLVVLLAACGGDDGGPSKPPDDISREAPTYAGSFADMNRFPTGVDMALDADGRFYIEAEHRMKVYSPTGELLGYWGPLSGYGKGVAVDTAGFVYVADGYGGIDKYTPEGAVVASAQLSTDYRVERVAVGTDGMIYAPDSWAPGSLLVFAADLSPRESFKAVTLGPANEREIENLCIAQDGVFVLRMARPPFIRRVGRDGARLGLFGEQGSGPGQLVDPIDLATLPSGEILVLDRGTAMVTHYAVTGDFVRRWSTKNGPDEVGYGTSLALSVQGTVWVITAWQAREFAVDGSPLRRWPDAVEEPLGVIAPTVVAAHGGTIFVGGGRLLVYDAPGVAGRELPVAGVTSLVAGADGTLYLTRTGERGVWKYTAEGVFVTRWGAQSGTAEGQFADKNVGLALGPDGLLYACDSGNDRVQVFKTDGTFVRKFGSTGAALGQFSNPSDIRVTEVGDLLVLDGGNSRVQRLHPNGTPVLAWGSIGSGKGLFNGATGLAVGPDGAVYVADVGNQRVQKFTPDGEFLAAWGSVGLGPGQFHGPSAVCADAQGRIYVADLGNDRVQVFAYP